MKKILALTMALCMIFAMCAVSASADEPIKLTYAEVNPVEGTVVGDVALAFKEKLEELSARESAVTGHAVDYKQYDINNVLALPRLLRAGEESAG